MSSFDVYESISYIIPGTILLLGLITLFFWPWLRAQFGGEKGKFDLSKFGALIIVAFVLGHLLHGLYRLVGEQQPWSCESGVYGVNVVVLHPDKLELLSSDELSKLRAAVQNKFNVTMKKPKEGPKGLNLKENKNEDLIRWCNVVMRVSNAVHQDKKGDLVDIFLRDYGLHFGLATAFVVLLLCALFITFVPRARPAWMVERPRRQQTTILLWAILALLLVSGLEVHRTHYFGKLYARALFLTFIDMQKNRTEG